MTAGTEFRTGGRLPAVALPLPADGGRVDLRSGRRLSTVIVTVHAGCAECRHYLAALRAVEAEIRDWDGRVLVVADQEADSAEALSSPGKVLRVVRDPDDRLRRAGVPTPAILIADQWGEIHAAEPAGPGHAFIAPDEVVSWLRYLAIQCPECQGEAL